MAGSQLSLELPDAATCQTLSGSSGWAPLFFPSDFLPALAGQVVLYPGRGLTAPYRITDRPEGRLSAPRGTPAAMAWGLCGQMALSALMGVSLDYLRSVWRGDASQGTCMEDMLRFVRGYCEVSAFSTTRYDRETLIVHADGLQWPICGMVAVTLPDGEPHWVATLNGLIYDCLQDEMLDVLEWDRRNRPYTIDDVIITGPGILSLPNKADMSNGLK